MTHMTHMTTTKAHVCRSCGHITRNGGWVRGKWRCEGCLEGIAKNKQQRYLGSPARPTRAATEKGGDCGEKETRQEAADAHEKGQDAVLASR